MNRIGRHHVFQILKLIRAPFPPTPTQQPAPKNPDDYRLYFDKKFMYAVPAPNEKTATVLVVGATGETGRQVVKKLILKGAWLYVN